MKKWVLVCWISIVSLIGAVQTAQATIIVYQDQASFLANAGSTTVYDFESDTVGVIGSVHDFGDFSIDSTSAGIYLSEVRNQNGNTDIYMNSMNDNASLNILFDHAVTAFGFTYVAEGNDSWDHSLFKLGSDVWDLGTPGDSGFFGIVDTTGTFAAGTAFSFGQQSTNWSGVSFDNLRYSTDSTSSASDQAPVPEPASLLLLGAGLLTLAGVTRKK